MKTGMHNVAYVIGGGYQGQQQLQQQNYSTTSQMGEIDIISKSTAFPYHQQNSHRLSNQRNDIQIQDQMTFQNTQMNNTGEAADFMVGQGSISGGAGPPYAVYSSV